MKTEEGNNLINGIKNKLSLNPIISLEQKCNDLKKIDSSVNIINTSGSQAIVIFKKISKSFKINKSKKNDIKISDNSLRKKINQYKSLLSFPNQHLTNPNTHIIKNNKNSKNIKTMRGVNKKIIDKENKNKKLKSKEKTQVYESNYNNKYTKKKINRKNKKEINQKENNNNKKNYNNQESHSHGHFNKKEKIVINNFINKSTNEIKYLSNNININNNITNYNINIQHNDKNIKLKIKKLSKNKLKEESKVSENIENVHKKNEYIETLVKNGILNISNQMKILKNKTTKKDVISKKKQIILIENGANENNINNNIKTKKIPNAHIINNLNSIQPIRTKNISTKNSIKKSKNLNISKSNSRFISFYNNNSNIDITNTNNNYIETNNTNFLKNDIYQETHSIKKSIKNRTILKPKINQFEFINRILKEQKKLNTQNVDSPEKNLKINENESKLSDSFRHENKIPKLNLNSKKINDSKNNLNIKSHYKKNSGYSQLKIEKNKKFLEDIDNDEFPFSHRKSYRSPKEIMKYLKDKRIETKKEEENTEKEKQFKAYATFQNLLNIAKKSENNINIMKIEPKKIINKIRKESNKDHLNIRKEKNEYYIGTESSKNNSTFIDKKEYYISILESKNFVNQTKINKQDEDEKEKDNNLCNKISIEILEHKIEKNMKNKNIKNKLFRKKLNRGYSSGFFENKKNIDELYLSINRANKIFSKENLNKFKNELLKTSIETNNVDEKVNNNKNINSNNKNYILNKVCDIKIEIPDIENNSSNIMINNRNKIENKINNSNQKQNKLLSYSISFNNLNSINLKEKITKNYSHTYSKSLNKNGIFKKRSELKDIVVLINSLKLFAWRRFFSHLCKLNFETKKKKNYLIAIKSLIIISKIYAFRNLEKYTKYLEYYDAFKELFKPFLHNKFKIFYLNCYEMKIRKFILILEIFFKYKAMNKLFIYCERDFKREIINFLILTIQKPFFDYFVEKLFLFDKYRINYYNEKIDYNQYQQRQNIDEEIAYLENDNIFNREQNYIHDSQKNHKDQKLYIINHDNYQSNEINKHIKIKEYLNIDTEDNNFSINKNYFKKFSEIKNPEKFAEEISDLIVKKLLNTELKLFSPYENIIPNKSFKYDFKTKSQNDSLSNSYLGSSCTSLEQLSFINNSYSNLNESVLSQMSYFSEFNKTIKDKKREQDLTFYNEKIGPKLICLICDEIKNNYLRIIKNISIPLKTDFKEVVIAIEIKDNEKLKQNYRVLKVNEELKDIIHKEKIIRKFEKINRRIRMKYNRDNINENYDLFLNLNLIDTAIELINKERLYGEIGEPFAFNSLRTRSIGFKYQVNDSKKLVNYVQKNLIEFINNPIFLINDNTVNTDEKNIIKYFKKDLKDNEEQWQDMEIVETQSKLEVTELILDQLYNEVIEILEHVQLSRKRPELYQEKSIYACEDIPKLSFQQTTTENEYVTEVGAKN